MVADKPRPLLQVNLFQKPSFLHQLTKRMTRDCSLNYKKIKVQNMLCTKIDIQNNICTQHVLNLYFSCVSMNNLSSYCGLTDARMKASEKYLSVKIHTVSKYSFLITKQLTSLYVVKAFRTLPFAYKGLKKNILIHRLGRLKRVSYIWSAVCTLQRINEAQINREINDAFLCNKVNQVIKLRVWFCIISFDNSGA